MDPESSTTPINSSEEEMELKEKEMLVKCKRTKVSLSSAQPQQEDEVSNMVDKLYDVLLHKVSAGEDPMNGFTEVNETARLRLPEICRANGWNELSYDFEKQGPSHDKLDCASMDPESSTTPVNSWEEEMEELLVKSKGTKFSLFSAQPQQEDEVSDMVEDEVSGMVDKLYDVLLHKVFAGKDPMSSCTEGNEIARLKLPEFCYANGLKESLYDFEEQRPPHNKLGCASMDPESSTTPINSSEEEMELKGKVKDEVSDMEDKVSDVLLPKVSAGKDPMNSCTEGNEIASLRLPKICRANGWKEPLYDFEEQGPPHNKLFTCKVTVCMEGITNTLLECFGDPNRQKEATQEHAARGALWFLAHFAPRC